ncbi:FAD/NAD(P)-binding protein [Falsirhodobacter halotolerans]|uniref:FAD/NAD(P)-binding protein n=1 Tax=Falsirhodobacter halotolerans TaxID=1146892 RepID=UPI001FD40C02|nr:FAD/NAD(P)-binding protein [Falsirhodobacter halotolerans]MCJ8138304.1 FAD/NAD(P)-binding protein [Falsirhodobacter halotolerans]
MPLPPPAPDPAPCPADRHALIIGGGASGVLAAAHILRADDRARVTIFDPNPRLAEGIAYGTRHPGHLLNVPAGGMSAFADRPAHFTEWLHAAHPEGGWTDRSFAPRMIYADYLRGLIAPFAGTGRLHHVTAAVTCMEDSAEGVWLTTEGGVRHHGDEAILAIGNQAPPPATEPWMTTFWDSFGTLNVPPDAPVAILGTGLSMVDSVISLLDAGHRGRIAAFSRRGLLPRGRRVHAPPPVATPLPDRITLRGLIRVLRANARATGDWRGVVDGIRPMTQDIWQSLSAPDKERFLRHARPWWDVHRHRMAPEIDGRIQAAIARGQLIVQAARVRVQDQNGHPVLTYRLRGRSETLTFRPAHVIDCRGSAGFDGSRNAFLAQLLASGRAVQDLRGLGLKVSAASELMSADGATSPRVRVIGPATIGAFWETVAVPDIRMQAAGLAQPVSA